jgi:two-component system, cell cycle sensor histidine kinase and response regulator CckA
VSDTEKNILVMDDEEIVADIARQMLAYLGYNVVVVENGEQAIKGYRQAYENSEPYALVILDLNIPGGMGGMEAVQHILEIDATAKVLVSSGYPNDPIMEEYDKYGFCGCIAKPFDLKGLEAILQEVIS